MSTFEGLGQPLLTDTTRAAAVDAALLRSLVQRLAAVDTYDALLGVAAENGPEGLRISPALLAVVNADGLMELAASIDLPVADQLTPVPLDVGYPLAEAISTRAPIWIETEQDRDRWYPELKAFTDLPIAAAVLPLEIDDVSVGALGLCFGHEHRFTERERSYFELLADLCALAFPRVDPRWPAALDIVPRTSPRL